MFRCFTILFLAGMAFLSLSTSAHADTLSFTARVDAASNPFSQSILLSRFDAALGTLTGVSLQLDASLNATVSIYNSRATLKSYTEVSFSSPVTLSGPGINLATALASAQPYTVPHLVLGRQTAYESNLTASGTATGAVPLSSFAWYTGTGKDTVAVNFFADDVTAKGKGDAGLLYSAEGSTSATVRVTYTYNTPNSPDASTGNTVPEPGVLGLFAVGILPATLAIVRRRK